MNREPSKLVGALVFTAAVLVIAYRALAIMYGFDP